MHTGVRWENEKERDLYEDLDIDESGIKMNFEEM
jgi:hypothetical protein